MSRYKTPEDFRLAAWAVLADGVADKNHPARHPTLGTLSAEGPRLRTLAMRAFDPAEGVVEMHTDRLSEKVQELEANPVAAIHIWDPQSELQLRLIADVSMVTGDPDLWSRVPDLSRGNYGVEPAPGTPIAAGEAFSRVPHPDRLTVLRARLTSMDLVYLGEPVHLRAQFNRTVSGWDGHWVAP